MKKIILVLGLSIAIFSCSKSSENKKKESITSFLEQNAKDPKSYELVELKVLDTVSVSDISKKQIENLESENLDYSNEILNQQNKILDYRLTGHVDSYEDLIARRNKTISTYEEIKKANLAMINKAKKNISNSSVVGYIYGHKFRLKNGFGALDLSENYISFDKNDSLLSFSDAPNYIVFKKILKK